MDADEHGLRDFAKQIAHQALSELKEPNSVPEKKCMQSPRLVLQTPGEASREEVALATMTASPTDMTLSSNSSAASRSTFDVDTRPEGVLPSATNEDCHLTADTQQPCREQHISEKSCREKTHNDAVVFARSMAEPCTRGPGQTFDPSGKVGTVRQFLMEMRQRAAQAAELHTPSYRPAAPKGNVKGLTAMWEKKRVLASVPHPDSNSQVAKLPGFGCVAKSADCDTTSV